MTDKIRESRQTPLRLGAEHDLKLEQICGHKGWDKVQAIRAALDTYHKVTFGRSSADMVPIELRRPRAPKGR
jgi:hypothetical protein